jgi:hypothetical protein
MRTLRLALLASAGAAILAVLLSSRLEREMRDFEVYWTAAARATAAAPIYRAEDEHYQFKYLPAFAVLSAPAAALPLTAAKGLWFAASVGLLVALVGLSITLLPETRKPAWLLVLVTVVAMAKFYAHELVLGQVNALFGVIVVLALLALARRREIAAGLLIALAIVVKPYAVIFLPWLFGRRRHASTLAAAGGLAVALALPVAVYGASGTVALHLDWWRTVTTSTAPNLTNADNVSIAAMYAKWLGAGVASARLAALTAAVLLIAIAMAIVRRSGLPFPEGLEGALLMTSIPLLSPQGWDYVFLISTPAVVYLVNYEDRLPAPLRLVTFAALATIGLSLYDVMGRAAYRAFMALSIITVCYLAIVAALCALRWRRAA